MRRFVTAGLILLPVVEIAVAVGVARLIGVGATVVALIALSVGGFLILRTASRRTWQDLRDATEAARSGRTAEIPRAEGRGLLVTAGILLAVPGFVTAAAGAVLLLPPVRTLVRGRASRWMVSSGAFAASQRFAPADGPGVRRSTSSTVVEGEVVGDDAAEPGPERPPEDGGSTIAGEIVTDRRDQTS